MAAHDYFDENFDGPWEFFDDDLPAPRRRSEMALGFNGSGELVRDGVVIVSNDQLNTELRRSGSAPRIDPLTGKVNIMHNRARGGTEMTRSNATEVAKIRRDLMDGLERLVRAEAEANRFPGEPPIGTVLRFAKHFPRSTTIYSYVAFRADNGTWYLTGSSLDNMTPSWQSLRDMIGSEECHMATEWKEIPNVEPEAVDAITDPAKWYELVFGKSAPNVVNGDASTSTS